MTRVHLHQVKPRELAGARTGRAYEYQYELAAIESLRLLGEDHCVCVYCEWHDDYVVETQENAVVYDFHQVKTRGIKEGPWSLATVFGLKRGKKPKPADERSIAYRLLQHRSNFGASCGSLFLVTNNAIRPEFAAFLTQIRTSTKIPDDLDKHARSELERICSAYRQPQIGEAELIEFLRVFRVVEERPPPDGKGTIHTIIDRVSEMSEVDLTRQQALQIGTGLVDLVRLRSHVALAALPGSVEELRAKKGICTDDVLRVLCLSPAGYRALRTQGSNKVKQLSRLQRLCAASGVPEDSIRGICELKSNWDSWYMAERENVDPADLMTLRVECGELLRRHAAGKVDIIGLSRECGELNEKYSHLTGAAPLSKALIMGHVFAIAAETGDWA